MREADQHCRSPLPASCCSLPPFPACRLFPHRPCKGKHALHLLETRLHAIDLWQVIDPAVSPHRGTVGIPPLAGGHGGTPQGAPRWKTSTQGHYTCTVMPSYSDFHRFFELIHVVCPMVDVLWRCGGKCLAYRVTFATLRAIDTLMTKVFCS